MSEEEVVEKKSKTKTKTYSADEYKDVQDKLDEFRVHNRQLFEELETLNTKFDGIDVDVYNEMLNQQQAQKDKKLIDAGKIDELLEERTKLMREKHNKEIEKIQKLNKTLNNQLETLVIDNAVRDSATKAGVVDTGIDDVLLRSQSVFSLEKGRAVPHDQSGNIIYGEGTSEPMSVREWVKSQIEVAPHLFKASQGSGSEHTKNFIGNSMSDASPLDKIKKGLAK